ncbi:O-GlcNAc transferase [Baffinella frigidus]|nr:O-GlcNAc transferase [Cryptophyta sp. CCMP2293]
MRSMVAYVSYCFSAHPTSYLIAGLFRLHDRTRFESVCFSLVTSDGSRPRGEIEADCGTFRDVSGLTVAESSRELNLAGVHVAVNLDGWTSMGRTNEIFAMSPAPIQVQYMGFPGSLGASYVHLLVTDKIISPPELAGVYAEKLVVLPNYYINDYRRQNWTPPPRPALPNYYINDYRRQK